MKKKDKPLSGQKNFYFQDYNYSENIKDKNSVSALGTR